MFPEIRIKRCVVVLHCNCAVVGVGTAVLPCILVILKAVLQLHAVVGVGTGVLPCILVILKAVLYLRLTRLCQHFSFVALIVFSCVLLLKSMYAVIS